MMMNLPCLMVSCTNFLRPICSYTECRLSFRTGSCPTGRTSASYSSCLYLIVTDLLSIARTDLQWTHFLAFPVGILADAVPFTLHLGLRISYPEPSPISVFIWNPAGLWNWWCCFATYAACAITWVGLMISPNSFFGSYVVPLVRIVKITLSILQAITISDCIFLSGLSFLVV